MPTFAFRRPSNTEKSRKTEAFKGEKKGVAFRTKLFVVGGLLALIAVRVQAATFTVTTTADTGANSLRQAITAANSSAGPDTIVFDIPGAGPHTIIISSALPDLASDISIVNDRPGDEPVTVEVAAGVVLRVFKVTPDNVVLLAGLTITKGKTIGTNRGGGIWNDHGNLTVRNCTLADNNSNDYGAGIYNDGINGSATLQLVGCLLFSNDAVYGGGVYNIGNGRLTVLNCTFDNNYGQFGGSGIYNDGAGGTGSASIFNSTFAENNTFGSGGTGGGGIRNYYATLEIGNNIFKGTNGGSVTGVNGTVISRGHNITNDAGGGDAGTGPGGLFNGTADKRNTDAKITALATHGGLTLTRSLQPDSPAIDGGDDAVQGAPLNLTTDQRGFARKVGAAVDVGALERGLTQAGPNFTVNSFGENNDPDCTTDDCTLIEAVTAANANPDANVVNFTPGLVGTVFNNAIPTGIPITAPVTINGPGARLLAISGRFGARVFRVASSGVTISGLSIINGRVSGDNGACIHNTGALTLTDCTVSSGLAIFSSAGGMGGGIYNAAGSSLTLNGCTLSNNAASTGHVGGNIHNAGILSATNTSILEGTATQGGGIYSEFSNNASKVSLLNCTITRCNATDMGTANGDGGGGLYFVGNSGQYDLANCIVAANTSQGGTNPDLRGNFTSKGHNLIGNVGFSTGLVDGTNADQVGGGPKPVKDARLDPVRRNNGGPTDTHALLSDSTAINAGGDALAPATDQRGYGRNGVSDIGAFELAGFLPVTLANISTRLRVETGDNVLIGGFIVTGTLAKKVIFRAIGPSLSQFFSDTLSNPTLELRDGTGALVDSNDNWVSSPNKQAIIDSGIAPSNDLESAIIATLLSNNSSYTAIVRGANNATGIGVVEAYDLDRTVDSKLANISTRGFVQTGNNVLIAGTIVLGTQLQKVIIRAIGPSLPLPGTLGNPTLELRDTNGGLVEANDDWVNSPNKQAIIDSTIPPANDLESAIVRTLSPAAYTAIVRGVNDTTGIAVVEVYALQ